MRRHTLLCSALTIAAASASAFAQPAPEAAQRLAQEKIIVDTHVDAPSILLDSWADLGFEAPDREFDWPRARSGGLDVGFMSIYTSASSDDRGTARQTAHMQIDAVEALAGRHPDKFAIVDSPGKVDKLREGGRVLLALGMENAAPIGDDLSQLQVFFDRGVRYITLAHSSNNRVADSSYTLEKRWNGLSPFGREVVAEMNRLGIMVDVSHVSDAALREAVEVSTVPVIASHSSMRHFTPGFERNISDELAQLVASRGGVVQIAFGNAFVNAEAAANTQAYFRASDEFNRRNAELAAAGEPVQDRAAWEAQWEADHPPVSTPLSAVLDNIDHAVKVVGIDHVGLGSDFDGVGGELPEGLRTVADYPNLISGLLDRGYSEEDIGKILGGNLLRVWAAVEAGAGR